MERTMIIGNLCNDPELKTTANGISVCTFTVAILPVVRREDGWRC